jgi:diguanylate cyclase (GGDEF)-like protein
VLQGAPKTAIAAGSQIQVLLVEGNQLLRHIMSDFIIASGCRVFTAGSGKEALELIDREQIQIVLADTIVPDMDGLELCRTIRQRRSDHYTYLILVTGRGSREDMIAGLEAGADEYLVKPVNQAELTARLKIAQRILDLERNLRRSLAEISRLSLRDPLTEVYNRRFMIERFPQEIKRAYRYERPLSVLILDLDHFKKINDGYGHAAGDRVICHCAEVLNAVVREDLDWVVRYGGEEFVVVLPETDLEGGMAVAERIRQQISAAILPDPAGGIHVTASCGVASLNQFPSQRRCGVEALLEAADRCLYLAKSEGRNRVRGIMV